MTLTIFRTSHTDPATLEAYHAVESAVLGHDLPGFPRPTKRMTYLSQKYGWTGRRFERFVAELDGRPVALLETVFPTLDNLNNMFFNVLVLPAFRRRGIGRALLDEAYELARANGRGKVMTASAWSMPGIPAHDKGAGPAFAAATDFESANLPEVMRRFDLSTMDRGVLDAMLDKARTSSSGYRSVRWVDEAPEEYTEDLAYLDSRLGEDAPSGDSAWEPEKVDVQRLREGERLSRLRDFTSYHTAVVHEESGHVVAWTKLSSEAELEGHCWQMITIVEPRHRGHRLGALVKVENLLWYLENESDTKVIDTFNAAENSHMIAINEEMGFRPLFAFQNWQRDL